MLGSSSLWIVVIFVFGMHVSSGVLLEDIDEVFLVRILSCREFEGEGC